MNLEDNFKDKLERRRLEPTASAWDRIEGKLDASQGKKKSKIVLWMGIAASFIAGVFITALVFSSNSGDDQLQIVETQPQDAIESKKTEAIEDIKFQDLVNEDVEPLIQEAIDTDQGDSSTLTTKSNLNKNKRNPTKSNYKPYVKPSVVIPSQESLAIVDANKKDQKRDNETSFTIDTTASPIKVIVDNTIVTDNEVKMLLENARLALDKRQAFETEVIMVDAHELLLDAEAEVDPDSFKDRMFKVLKKEFSRAVEAVANKDN